MDITTYLLEWLKNKTNIQKNTRIPMFIAALFTIAKIWKQSKCPNMVYTHTHTHTHTQKMEYYSAIKRMKFYHLQQQTNGLGGYYARWNKSDRERQIQYDITYMWNLKNTTNLWI